MCLAVPGQVVAIEEGWVVVERMGVRHTVSSALLDELAIGDWVLVHAGFAIARLDPHEAAETLALLARAGLDAHDYPPT